MSWEEMYTCSATCPCGKGKMTQTSYGDDWNRYKDGPESFHVPITQLPPKVTSYMVIAQEIVTMCPYWGHSAHMVGSSQLPLPLRQTRRSQDMGLPPSNISSDIQQLFT